MSKTYRALFVSHGGGPLPLLGDKRHQEMVDCLKDIATKIQKPSAIVVISAHWESTIPTITAATQPDLIYDYYGFPDEAYHFEYPCKGEAGLADDIAELFRQDGKECKLDRSRGFDHGLYVPLKIMYPDADIPCVQLSMQVNLDPEEHIRMGKMLRNLDYENLLVMGSGFSFHNKQEFFLPETDETRKLNLDFESWLETTCCSSSLSEAERAQTLIDWEQAPGSRYCHPHEEHLIPVHVCYGYAQRPATRYCGIKVMDKKASMIYWD